MVNGFTDSDGTKIQGANYPIVGDTYTFNIFDEDGDPMWSEARKAQAALPQAGLNFRPKGGIPHSFIIDKKGMVVWRGHPAEIGHPKGRVTEENIERLLKGEDMLKIDLPKKK